MRRLAWFAFLPVVVAFGAAGCGSPTVPDKPAYDVDVRPILMAHCARCHGAGDMLNAPPGVDSAGLQVSRIFLDRYASEGDCSNDPTTCKLGAQVTATALPGVIRNPSPTAIMPPPPSPELDDWAVDIINNWVKNNNAACSNSLTPDLAICPP